MSYKDEVNTAVHNYYHDDTELEMAVKDWLYEQSEKAKAFDEVIKINKNCRYLDDFDRNIRDVIRTYESEAD